MKNNNLKKLVYIYIAINSTAIFADITFKFTNRGCKPVNVKIYHEHGQPNVAEFGGVGQKGALGIQSGIDGSFVNTAILPQIAKFEVCESDGTDCKTTTAQSLVGDSYIKEQKSFVIRGNKDVEIINR